MKPDVFRKVNWKTALLLSLMLAVLFINGMMGLYSLYRSHNHAAYYANAASRIQDVRVMFQKQVQMWKNMLLNRERVGTSTMSGYSDYYYQFSQFSSRIQDELFNLKIELSGDERFSRPVRELREIHHSLSNQYVALVFRMQQADGASVDPAEAMREREEMAMTRMENITKEIQDVSEIEMENSFRNYFILALLSVVLLVILSTAMVVYILLINRRIQGRMVDIADRLNTYLPPQLVRSVIVGDASSVGLINRRPLTVCFTDLQGFTAMSEKLPPETTARILNEYLSDMTTIAHAWGGMVDKFIGDGIMILFGALEDTDERDQAENCVLMARAMQAHMVSLRNRWHDEGVEDPVRLRIGVHSGVATVGTFGPADRRAYTAVGTAVNIASRLEKLCSADGILISDTTRQLIGDTIEYEAIGPSEIRGLSERLELYRVLNYETYAAPPSSPVSPSSSPTRT